MEVGARGCRGVAVALLLAGALAGCSTVAENASGVAETASGFFSTSPGKFDIYTCQDLEPIANSLRTRRIELEQLMARASQGSGGSFVSAIAYRTEYEQASSDIKELAKTRADKQCAVGSKFSSGRAVF
jgi:hypothetical protein